MQYDPFVHKFKQIGDCKFLWYATFAFVCRYILYTGFSATSALTDWSSVFYSLIYTSLSTIVVGILDKDLSHRTLLHYPKLYGAGQRNESYNMCLFWLIMLDTLWQSLVLFYVPFLTYRNSTIDIWSMGSLWTISVVILVNVHLAMDIQCWVLITHIATWGSIVVTYAFIIVLDSIPVYPNYGLVLLLILHLYCTSIYSSIIFILMFTSDRTIYHLAVSETYWLTILLTVTVALLPRFLWKVIQQRVWPSDIQIAREAEILRKSSDRYMSWQLINHF